MTDKSTTTTLNPGTGGDAMDETSVTQADGSTVAKRANVAVGFSASDPQDRIVGSSFPLPTADGPALEALERIASAVEGIYFMISAALTDGNGSGSSSDD